MGTPRSQRGAALITTMLMVSAFLIYSNTLTMRTVNQHVALERMRQGQHALNLAQAALEQLLEEFTDFVSARVNQEANFGNLLSTMDWFDALNMRQEAPALDLPEGPNLPDGQPDATLDNPRFLQPRPSQPGTEAILPSLSGAPPDLQPRAWILGAERCNPADTDSLAARCVTFRAEASVGSVHKAVEGVFQFSPRNSRVFDYAYFLNNYGWFDNTYNSDGSAATQTMIWGEVRSNGNLRFTGPSWVLGDLYASTNSELGTGPGQPGEGRIIIDPRSEPREFGWPGMTGWEGYWRYRAGITPRPTQDLVWQNQVKIGGSACPQDPATVPLGFGWDSDSRPDPANPDQRLFDEFDPDQMRFDGRQPQTIPYLGDLSFYKALAAHHTNEQGGQGSTVSGFTRFEDNNLDGQYEAYNYRQIPLVNGVYYGPDGQQGTADDYDPLVLYGYGGGFSIDIDGPIVTQGDVIIRGPVTGQGSIYAGRNIHIVGPITYAQKPQTWSVERNVSSGRIRRYRSGCPTARPSTDYLGWVCTDGSYYDSNRRRIDPNTGDPMVPTQWWPGRTICTRPQ